MPTRDRILAHLKDQKYQPVKTSRLARFFDIGEQDYAGFRTLVKELLLAGEIAEVGGGKLVAAGKQRKVPNGMFTGIMRLSSKGFGFIEHDDPPQDDDVFVPPGATGGAITGDRVMARLVKRKYSKPGQSPYTGDVTEIVTRGHTTFVGTYRVRGKFGSIKPDGGVLLVDEIPVPDASAAGAKPNDKVVFELLKYPALNQAAEAVIVEVLGPRGQPGVDTLAVIRQFELPDKFPEAVLDEARRAVERFTSEETARRTDLRELLTITIDPETARDFDDAVSLENLPNGVTRLGVHIADVSFFVRPGEALDTEAYKRGTSVYLPTEVLPMLPEILSNGICSLQEGQDRLVETAFIDLDREARVVGTSFARSVIRNHKRMTYAQVSQVLDEGRLDVVGPEIVQLLNEMNALARRMLARRRRAGYLELDLPEVELVFNDDGAVIDARPEDTAFSHKIIEMFMVEANEAVARRLAAAHRPAIRRIHEAPNAEKLETLGRFLRAIGKPVENPQDRGALQALLKTTHGDPAAYPVHMAVLRSMMRAEYAVSDAGHWALGSQCYAHFTSPIRRYPDLSIHRCLAEVEKWTGDGEAEQRRRGGRHKEDFALEDAALVEAAAHCSSTERRAEAAERELTKVKVLTLLEQHLGEEFSGVVSSVQAYGLFVEIPKYMIEGLVHIDQLHYDDYQYVPARFALVGRKEGRRICVGDTIHVVIAAVDIPRRELTLAPAAGEKPGTVPVAKPGTEPRLEKKSKAPRPGKRGKDLAAARQEQRKRRRRR